VQQESSRSTGEEHKKGGLQKAGEGKREVNTKVGRERVKRHNDMGVKGREEIRRLEAKT
jgi:hypothetical protein